MFDVTVLSCQLAACRNTLLAGSRQDGTGDKLLQGVKSNTPEVYFPLRLCAKGKPV